MEYSIIKPDPRLQGEISLPASKSISNRLLIIQALSSKEFRITNLSDSDDTRVLENALQGDGKIIDIGHAGTSMRFLTAYLSITEGERVLTGSERMKDRPIGELVAALRELGADIRYLEKNGYPPLMIRGRKLKGGRLVIDSSLSSQFISALLMIAPVLDEGLQLRLTGHTVSSAYINLTLKLMESFGISYRWSGDQITIRAQEYRPCDTAVEADWSAASYWYEMAALAEEPDLLIRGLSSRSLQGDSVLSEICKDFGIHTEYLHHGIKITGSFRPVARYNHNFSDHPDLVQTFTVLCCLRNIPFRFAGTETLRVKETDRIMALAQELSKFDIRIRSSGDGRGIDFDGRSPLKVGRVSIDTYQDHRMAMSFAPAAMLGYRLDIQDPDVVSKSYPGYWEDLRSVGFEII
ncbi:MAG: hypothetical protein AMS27_05905 [Bacteroides sp. SM23_62_1]|nr:MAG: hypothetical protein AMS27_05905 [Bacteroides sp. SM23_62_1]